MSAKHNFNPQADNGNKPHNGWLTYAEISQFLKQFHTQQQNIKQEQTDRAIFCLTIAKAAVEVVACGEQLPAVIIFEDLAQTIDYLNDCLVSLTGAE